MKVLIIHTLYSQAGGEDTIVRNESYDLSETGLEVKTIYFRNRDNLFSSAVNYLLLPFNFFSYFRIRKIVREFKPDVAHLHNWSYAGSPAIIRAVTRYKVPIVLSIHNFRLLCPSATLFHDGKLFVDSLTEKFPWSAIKKGVFHNSKFITFWLAFTVFLHKYLGTWKRVARYIVNTEFNKRLFLQSTFVVPPEKIQVKPNSTRLENDVSQRIETKFYLFVGRLTEEKGVHTLLTAFAKCRLNLIIIGDGPLRTEVIETCKANPNIQYLGLQSHTTVKRYMGSAQALIFPSIWYEGMPMTIVETFAVGTPVIASKIGAMEEMIIDNSNGYHFAPNDSDNLIARVLQCDCLNNSDYQKLRTNAELSYYNHHTPTANVKSLIGIYQTVMDEQATIG